MEKGSAQRAAARTPKGINLVAQALACSYGSVRQVAVGFSLRLIGVPQTSDPEMSAGVVFGAPERAGLDG